jgi:mRNA interferase RelE/StbE
MYKIFIEKRVFKSLLKIPDPYYSNIKSAVIKLAENPRPLGYKKLINRDAYRIRVSNYRVIYEIIDHTLIINVIEIGHRKEVYK